MAILNLTIDKELFESAARDFTPVPAGKYPVSIFDIKAEEVKQGDNKGKIKLKVQFKIEEGFVAHDGTKVGNRRLFADVNTFGGISGPNSKKPGTPYGPFDLIALGKAIGKIESAEDLASIDTDDWLGLELEVEVEHKFKRVQVGDKWIDSDELPESHPDYYTKRENIKGYRSTKAASTAKAAATGGKSKASKFSL
ncbi:MAG: hypothetical protein ACTHJ9_17810 [Rhodanobacter sp.]